MNTQLQVASKLPNVGPNIFGIMSALAVERNAFNLGQCFLDFDCDPALVDAIANAMRGGMNQYPPMRGTAAIVTITPPKSRSPPGPPKPF